MCMCVFFFLSSLQFFFYRGCSASWLNYAGVRNLFQFKQDALTAQAQSQITSIHSSESWMIGIHGVKNAGFFAQMPNICYNADILSHHERVWVFINVVSVLIIAAFFCFLNCAAFHFDNSCLCLLALCCDGM